MFPICAESAVKHKLTNMLHIMSDGGNDIGSVCLFVCVRVCRGITQKLQMDLDAIFRVNSPCLCSLLT